MYQAISELLDTRSYQHAVKFDDLSGNVTTVIYHFSSVLNNNYFDCCKVKNEFEMIYKHVCCFKSNTKPANCWPAIFNLRSELGVNNALIVAEICLVTPPSNSESKQTFSFLWRNFSKERSSMKNDSMENIFCLCNDNDFSKQHYCHDIKLFLEEYSDAGLEQLHAFSCLCMYCTCKRSLNVHEKACVQIISQLKLFPS